MDATLCELDLATLPPERRRAAVLTALAPLPMGGGLELVSDHDPQELYHALRADLAGDFAWHYLQSGPSVWRIGLRKIGLSLGAGGCCGACGGGRR